jgi:tetratricopeptide (TPR) repeat protein
LAEYDRALSLKPDFAAAHSERGSLYYQMGKPESALADLESAVTLRPDDAVSLDRLGQTYLALDRTGDAVRVLRQATALSPDDSKMQLHFARALADADQTAESKTAMDRFRQMGPAVNHAVPGGLVDYLSLSPEERHADYRRRVERLVRDHPEDAAGELDYLQLLLDDGDFPRAAETAHKLAQLKALALTLASAGRELLDAGQYVPARELLEQASAGAPPAGVRLDLARAAFYVAGASEGMRLLDGVPESERGWDFYLARAEILDAAGDASAAAEALAKALGASPEAYVQAGLYLLRKGRSAEAARIGGDGVKSFPTNREILLVRAVALQMSGAPAEAQRTLEQIQNRWPEWAAAWAVDGIVLGMGGNRSEAAAALRTAIELGANMKELKAYVDAPSNAPDLVDVLTKSLRTEARR